MAWLDVISRLHAGRAHKQWYLEHDRLLVVGVQNPEEGMSSKAEASGRDSSVSVTVAKTLDLCNSCDFAKGTAQLFLYLAETHDA